MDPIKLLKSERSIERSYNKLKDIKLPTKEKMLVQGKLFVLSLLVKQLVRKYVHKQPSQLYALRKDAKSFATDDFLDDLFEGRVKPEDYLDDPEPVKQAVAVINGFMQTLIDEDIMEIV